MPNITLNLVMIRSEERDRALEFYRVLGLEFTKHRHGTGPEHYAAELDENASSVGTRLGFRVASVDAALENVQLAGARVVAQAKDSPWRRRAVIADPNGHRVELVEASQRV